MLRHYVRHSMRLRCQRNELKSIRAVRAKFDITSIQRYVHWNIVYTFHTTGADYIRRWSGGPQSPLRGFLTYLSASRLTLDQTPKHGANFVASGSFVQLPGICAISSEWGVVLVCFR